MLIARCLFPRSLVWLPWSCAMATQITWLHPTRFFICAFTLNCRCMIKHQHEQHSGIYESISPNTFIWSKRLILCSVIASNSSTLQRSLEVPVIVLILCACNLLIRAEKSNLVAVLHFWETFGLICYTWSTLFENKMTLIQVGGF